MKQAQVFAQAIEFLQRAGFALAALEHVLYGVAQLGEFAPAGARGQAAQLGDAAGAQAQEQAVQVADHVMVDPQREQPAQHQR